MLLSEDRRTVISNFGWCDGGSVPTFDVKSLKSDKILTGGSGYARLYLVEKDKFLCHTAKDEKQIFQIRSFSDPNSVIAEMTAEICFGTSAPKNEVHISGNQELWNKIPRHYMIQGTEDHNMIVLDPNHLAIEVVRMTWFNSGKFDLGYQSIVDVLPIPEKTSLLFSVLRSGVLYEVSSDGKSIISEIKMGSGGMGGGNANLLLSNDQKFLICNDYDTINVFKWPEIEQVSYKRYQYDENDMTRKFIGNPSITSSDKILIPRPLSNDVILVNFTELKEPTCRALFDIQPLEAVQLSDGTILARDWKTGKMMIASLEQIT